jgi:large subunit ribosomal protein L21
MYAIIDDSGQQFRVQEGDEIEIDIREGEPGSSIQFDKVVLVGGGEQTLIGKPHVTGASVTGEVLEAIKGPKLEIYKYRRRKKSRRHVGHRQKFLSVKIIKINA